MPLSGWLRNGWVLKHETSRDEVSRLLDVVDRDLGDGAVPGASEEGRFLRSYNAALQSAVVALYAAGYKPEKGLNHHFRALQSLGETIGLSKEELAVLEAYRKKRNITEYERTGVVSERDAQTMLEMAGKISRQVREFVSRTNPKLLPKVKSK